jgi:hypothetical protein
MKKSPHKRGGQHNIHNVFHIRLSLFLKQLDMNEEDILRITDEVQIQAVYKI